MTTGHLQHLVPRRAREVRVVQHDAAGAASHLAVELVGEGAERAAALVAVEPDVATGDMLLRDRALPGAGDAHHENDLRVVTRASPRRDTP